MTSLFFLIVGVIAAGLAVWCFRSHRKLGGAGLTVVALGFLLLFWWSSQDITSIDEKGSIVEKGARTPTTSRQPSPASIESTLHS